MTTKTKLVKRQSSVLLPERDIDKSPVLECVGLGVTFGGLKAVEDFDLTIGRTEIAGLIGPNGAGKTTTLHAISGLLRSASGSITLDGTDLQSVPANSIIRMGLAHVPEGRHVFAQMTVEENLKMGAYTISDARLVAENMERVYGHFPQLKERRRQLAEDDRVRKAYLGA